MTTEQDGTTPAGILPQLHVQLTGIEEAREMLAKARAEARETEAQEAQADAQAEATASLSGIVAAMRSLGVWRYAFSDSEGSFEVELDPGPPTK
jgi:regulator of protease activity HflC (stomatin/prohibitin superfamily)